MRHVKKMKSRIKKKRVSAARKAEKRLNLALYSVGHLDSPAIKRLREKLKERERLVRYSKR